MCMEEVNIKGPQDLQERADALGPVACFEGFSLTDFKQGLFDLPEKEVALNALGSYALDRLLSGDPGRVDPGDEAYIAAEIFTGPYAPVLPFAVAQSDLDSYALEYFSAHREVVAREYHLESVEHPFAGYFDNVSPYYFHDFRGLPVFDQLPDLVSANLPQISEHRELNVLYPGSGSHIAPLLTAMKLIDSGIIDRATFTFTEISDYSSRITGLLELGIQLGIFDSVNEGGPKHFLFAGTEQSFEITYKGKKIVLVFALNRSGKEYYREDYLRRADLVVLHDPKDGYLRSSYDLLAHMQREKAKKFPESAQMVVMEGGRRDWEIGFPESLAISEISGPYGHCQGFHHNEVLGEIWACQHRSAQAFLMNNPAFVEMASRSSSVGELSSLLFPEGQELMISVSVP